MANQVKIFKGSKFDILEKNVNKWLEENPDIKITQRLQSESLSSFIQGDRTKYIWNCTITIFYEELDLCQTKFERRRNANYGKLWRKNLQRTTDNCHFPVRLPTCLGTVSHRYNFLLPKLTTEFRLVVIAPWIKFSMNKKDVF